MKKGIEIAGGEAEIFQVPDVSYKTEYATEEGKEAAKVAKTNADFSYKILTRETLVEYDYYLFGIPTKFGNFPAEWKAFGTRILVGFGQRVLSMAKLPVCLFQAQ